MLDILRLTELTKKTHIICSVSVLFSSTCCNSKYHDNKFKFSYRCMERRYCVIRETNLFGNGLYAHFSFIYMFFLFGNALFSFDYALFLFSYIFFSFFYEFLTFSQAIFSFNYVLFSIGYGLFDLVLHFFYFIVWSL